MSVKSHHTKGAVILRLAHMLDVLNIFLHRLLHLTLALAVGNIIAQAYANTVTRGTFFNCEKAARHLSVACMMFKNGGDAIFHTFDKSTVSRSGHIRALHLSIQRP